MTETVPADIKAAISAYRYAVKTCTRAPLMGNAEAEGHAFRALNAAILKHLRNADEMKAALERIEQGV